MSGAIDRHALISEISRMLQDEYEDFLTVDDVTALAEYQAGRILSLVRPDPRIDAIRALHQPLQHYTIGQDNKRRPSYQTCTHDPLQRWPCATIRALGDVPGVGG